MVRRIATSFVRRTLDVAWSASLLVAVLVIASIHLLPILAFVLIMQRNLVAGLTAGAVKG